MNGEENEEKILLNRASVNPKTAITLVLPGTQINRRVFRSD